MKNINKRKNGISLIVLVITILVMIILAGVVVVSLSKNNPIEKAKEATFKQSLAQIGEELEMFCVNEKAQNSDFIKETLQANKTSLAFNTKTQTSGKNIYDILPSLKDSKYKNQVEVIAGSLFYRTPDKKEIPWLRELGIHYTGIVTGTVEIDGDTLVGVSPDYVNTGTLIIPSTVKKINRSAFAGCTEINSIVFQEDGSGNGIVEIPAYCFNGCEGLTSVTLPSTVKIIGQNAFENCMSLTSITLPRDLVTIKDRAFQNCQALNKVEFNNKLVDIGVLAFNACISLDKIELKEGVTTILAQSFQNTGAVNVTLPNSLAYVGYGAFISNKKLKTFNIGSGTTMIEPSVVRECSAIEKITIADNNAKYFVKDNCIYTKPTEVGGKISLILASPNATNIVVDPSTKYINNEAFILNKNLQSVTLPEGVVAIYGRAFEGCKSLTTLSIPSSIQTIGEKVLQGCDSLTTINIPSTAKYITENGVIYEKNSNGEKFKVVTSANTKALNNYVMPDTVTELALSAFAACTNLNNITVSPRLVTIGKEAFFNTSISQITLPSTLKTIEDYAFSWTKNLTKIDLGTGVTTIGTRAFHRSGVTSINLPRSVTNLANSAFTDARDLKSITVDAGNPVYTAENNVVYADAGKTLVALLEISGVYTVKEGVTKIATNSFNAKQNITKIILPSTITEIEKYAITECPNLTEVVIPSSIQTIGDNAFAYSRNLSRIIISKPEGSISGSPWGAPQGGKAVIWKW